MKVINKLIVIIIAVVAFTYFFPPQLEVAATLDNNLQFESLSIEQGLSHSSVYSIIQDKYGYMWFGTQNGLNKYDGTKFIIFRYDSSDLGTLSNNTIRSIYEDSNGVLWVGTDNGLNKYNRETNSFTHYFYDPDNLSSISDNTIRSIYEDSDGVLWIGTA
jgi:ligand-binding sensor domain-containing protein